MEDLWRIKERADDLWVAVNLNNRGLRVQARYRLTPASSQRELRTISQILNINVPVAARSIALKRRVDEKTFQAFEMYGLQNRNAAQVAEILGMSVASLYTAKSRCMKMMQEIIARYNRTDGELNLEL